MFNATKTFQLTSNNKLQQHIGWPNNRILDSEIERDASFAAQPDGFPECLQRESKPHPDEHLSLSKVCFHVSSSKSPFQTPESVPGRVE